MKKLLYSTLFIAAAALASCGNKENAGQEQLPADIINNPASAEAPAATEDGEVALPEFSFETDQHHFGVITQGEKVSYSFKFTNTGKAPLIISSAHASCGCTVPEYTKDPVQPGETGYVNVTYNSEGKSGMESKTVTLIANTVPNTKVLTISAEVNSQKK